MLPKKRLSLYKFRYSCQEHYSRNKLVIDKLNKEFNILNDDGKISLKNLKVILLSSEENKNKINSIVHPFFYKELNLYLVNLTIKR